MLLYRGQQTRSRLRATVIKGRTDTETRNGTMRCLMPETKHYIPNTCSISSNIERARNEMRSRGIYSRFAITDSMEFKIKQSNAPTIKTASIFQLSSLRAKKATRSILSPKYARASFAALLHDKGYRDVNNWMSESAEMSYCGLPINIKAS